MTWLDSHYDGSNPYSMIDETHKLGSFDSEEINKEPVDSEYSEGSVSKILQDRDNMSNIGNLLGAGVILGVLYLVYRRYS